MASTLAVDKIKKQSGDTFTLPSSDGSAGQFIKTDASGNLAFATGLASVAADTSPQLGGDLDCNSSQIQWSKGADVASATALAVLTDGNYFDVTGTTTIVTINTTGGAGTQIKLHFDGALTLTHHATDLILPGGANITTAANDEAEFIEYASGDYRCTSYTRASGAALKIADESIDSDAYIDGSVDLAHMSSESVDEDNLHISNAGSNGQFLSKQSGNAGGLTWATPSGGGGSTGIDDNADAVAMTINSDEQIGIAGTSPTARLHVVTTDADIGSAYGSAWSNKWIAVGQEGTTGAIGLGWDTGDTVGVIQTVSPGVAVRGLHINPYGNGVAIGAASGGAKGTGTLNAVGVYDDNSLLSCYVFDAVLDGTISDAKWDAKVPDRETRSMDEDTVVEVRQHDDMRKFKARLGTDTDPLDIDKYSNHWKTKRHLSSLPNEDKFDKDQKMATGSWIQRLVETVEIQAVHIDKLNERLKLLEG